MNALTVDLPALAAQRIRQQDIAPVETLRRLEVSVIGAGGIGSNFLLAAARLGLRLVAYDGDEVALENIGSQAFGPAHLGRNKGEAIAELCATLTGNPIRAIPAFARGGEPVRGIVIDATDHMDARAAVFRDVVLPAAEFVDAFLSVRMGAETGALICIRPADLADRLWYELEGLFPSSLAQPVPCTAKATSYCATVAAGLAVRAVKRLLMGQPVERQVDIDLANLMLMVDSEQIKI